MKTTAFRLVLTLFILLAWGKDVAAVAPSDILMEQEKEQSQLTHKLFVPTINHPRPILNHTPVSTPENVFQIIDSENVTRLRSVGEVGGDRDKPGACGQKGILEVHVFGPGGDGDRLNDILVEVTHTDSNGFVAQEILHTGMGLNANGIARFALEQQAEVRILTNEAGRVVSSDKMIVTTTPHNVPYSRLIQGEYCSEIHSCRTFVASQQCVGHLSWNIAFKR